MGNFVVEEEYERGFESLPIGIVEEPNKFNFFFAEYSQLNLFKCN